MWMSASCWAMRVERPSVWTQTAPSTARAQAARTTTLWQKSVSPPQQVSEKCEPTPKGKPQLKWKKLYLLCHTKKNSQIHLEEAQNWTADYSDVTLFDPCSKSCWPFVVGVQVCRLEKTPSQTETDRWLCTQGLGQNITNKIWSHRRFCVCLSQFLLLFFLILRW